MPWKQAQFIASKTSHVGSGDFTYTYEVPGPETEPREKPFSQPGTIVRIEGEPSWADVVRVSSLMILVGDYTNLDNAYEHAVIDDTHVLIRKHMGPMRWVPKARIIDVDYSIDAGWYLAIKESH